MLLFVMRVQSAPSTASRSPSPVSHGGGFALRNICVFYEIKE
ncbi:hypothetical protein HMPREF9163_00734 [Selenomonas sp. oral taxon 138 str. F0429]|nr:hypothetical protein HMPREF9163_00734 [Selenomonas sp. oral taxon 138 str. F0429]